MDASLSSLNSPPSILILRHRSSPIKLLIDLTLRSPLRVEDSKIEEERGIMCWESDSECRPLAWLLGLPFAFLALLLSVVGVIIWILGLLLSCVCPCCLCITIMVEFGIELIKAPLLVMRWFTEQIPC